MSKRDTASRLKEYHLEAATGISFPVYRGQVIRVEQITDSGQCADFNAFNLYDYKERFCAARTRVFHGCFPTVSDMLWSNQPRERVLFTIVEDTVGTNDLLFPRCSGVTWEFMHGIVNHTNCQDAMAEAIRKYRLTPDDVHDSFNIFMCTEVNANGQPMIRSNPAQKGDHLELLCHVDCVVALTCCGADMSPTSNFTLNPLKIEVYEATESEKSLLDAEPRFINQRRVDDFVVKEINPNRKLEEDPKYIPHYSCVPLTETQISVELDDQDFERINKLIATGEYGNSPSTAIKQSFFLWWMSNRMKTPDQLKQDVKGVL